MPVASIGGIVNLLPPGDVIPRRRSQPLPRDKFTDDLKRFKEKVSLPDIPNLYDGHWHKHSMYVDLDAGTFIYWFDADGETLNNATMSIPAAIYSIIMFFTAAAFGWWVNFAHGKELRREE